MSKAITEGCRAVIVNSVAGNNGVIVIIGLRFNGFHNFCPSEGDRWMINKSLPTFLGLKTNHMGENLLQRIDDGEQLGSWEELEQLTKWNPHKSKEVA